MMIVSLGAVYCGTVCLVYVVLVGWLLFFPKVIALHFGGLSVRQAFRASRFLYTRSHMTRVLLRFSRLLATTSLHRQSSVLPMHCAIYILDEFTRGAVIFTVFSLLLPST